MHKYLHPVENNMFFSSIVELANYRAVQQSGKTAYTFLSDDETQELQITYFELDQKAKAIAALLQDAKLAGERALLIYPPGLDFVCAFFACLYAGVIAVPIYPPINRQMMSSAEPIIKDSNPKVILTTRDISAKLMMAKPIQFVGEKSIFKIVGKGLDKFFPQIKLLNSKDRQVIATNDINSDLFKLWQIPEINSDSLAFLQYTSGSTSEPKGVMVSHGNILHNQNLIQDYFNQPPEPVFVSWLPQYHDMGLIGNILHPFYMGGRSILISPFAFLKKPITWLTAISKYGAYTSGGPNFGYELCIKKVKAEDTQKLDLSSWKVAYNGAEPIRSTTLKKFADFFADCGFQESAFYPCYGLAEGTLIVTGAKQKEAPVYLTCDKKKLKEDLIKSIKPTDPDSITMVGSGTAFERQKIRVVDPEEFDQLGDDKIGEIWISGPSVAQGYWGNPIATRITFQAKIRNSEENHFLRTGDLGFLKDGELFVTGRIKDLIIIRGQNYYPNDLEYTAENSNKNIRRGCSAAFSVYADGQEILALVCEIRKKLKKAKLKDIVTCIRRDILESYGIRAFRLVLIKPKTIPKTTSGKIQRRKCKKLLLNNKLYSIYQWQDEKSNFTLAKKALDGKAFSTEIKNNVRQSKKELYDWLLERINSTSIEKLSISNLENKTLSDTGLNSIELAELISDFEKEFNCSADLKVILETTSLLDFCENMFALVYTN